MKKTILVTGGAGYIGSHTCVELMKNGWGVVILDNLSNSDASVADRIGKITGETPKLCVGDILDGELLDRVLEENDIYAVTHFAALKSVPQSQSDPLRYYRNNVEGTLSLCRAMERHGVRNIVFSSSATVYGISDDKPIGEEAPLSPKNVYGDTKLTMENVLRALCAADKRWNATLLRYFNPVGAHESGLIGESPAGVPGNLMPYITQVAAGMRPHLFVTGTDYPTPDGTGIRDYIHVVDLAKGHISALENLGGLRIYNLGSGRGLSVREMVSAFERATGVKIPCVEAPRREGDLACYFADPSKANRELAWRTERSAEDMCRDAWNFAERYYKK